MTEAQQNVIRQMIAAGSTPTMIARATGVPRTTIREFLQREKIKVLSASQPTNWPKPETASPSSIEVKPQEVLADAISSIDLLVAGMEVPLDIPVQRLAVPLPSPIAVSDQNGELITALLYGDTHFPSQDPAALAIVGQIGEELQPNFTVHMGDIIDAYPLSRWDKNPERLETLQDEINQARVHLAQMRIRLPKSTFILLEGNHEDRLRRTLWNLQGTAAALIELTSFRKALTWPSLLGLEELGIIWLAYDSRQAKQKLLPKWILKHGTVIRKYSGYTARGEMEKYGRSGASGHSHRLGVHFHQDHNGNHCWVETGCTCNLDPEYMMDPDWQQGCVVMTFEPGTGAFQAEPIYIHEGLAVWRGKTYEA